MRCLCNEAVFMYCTTMRCLCKEAVFMYCTTVRCLCKESSCTPRTAFKRRHDSLPRTRRPLSNSSEDTTASLQLIRGHDGLSPTHPSLQTARWHRHHPHPPRSAAKHRNQFADPCVRPVMDAMWARLTSLSMPSATFRFNTGTEIP